MDNWTACTPSVSQAVCIQDRRAASTVILFPFLKNSSAHLKANESDRNSEHVAYSTVCRRFISLPFPLATFDSTSASLNWHGSCLDEYYKNFKLGHVTNGWTKSCPLLYHHIYQPMYQNDLNSGEDTYTPNSELTAKLLIGMKSAPPVDVKQQTNGWNPGDLLYNPVLQDKVGCDMVKDVCVALNTNLSPLSSVGLPSSPVHCGDNSGLRSTCILMSSCCK